VRPKLSAIWNAGAKGRVTRTTKQISLAFTSPADISSLLYRTILSLSIVAVLPSIERVWQISRHHEVPHISTQAGPDRGKMSNNQVGTVYQQIIQDVVESSRVDFEEGGVDEHVLEELKLVSLSPFPHVYHFRRCIDILISKEFLIDSLASAIVPRS
jgi:hypothetical protein